MKKIDVAIYVSSCLRMSNPCFFCNIMIMTISFVCGWFECRNPNLEIIIIIMIYMLYVMQSDGSDWDSHDYVVNPAQYLK